MTKETYVSFEVAKLLKEKGFDGKCRYYYPNGHIPLTSYVDCVQSIMFNNDACIAPTQQMAMKWLREVHHLFILIEYDSPVFSSDVYKMDEIDEYGCCKHVPPTFANCKSYEVAAEAAIEHCLENLI